MGDPNVFTFGFGWFIGVGISFSRYRVEHGLVLDIGISLPFVFIGIFCKKTKENNWI